MRYLYLKMFQLDIFGLVTPKATITTLASQKLIDLILKKE